MISLSSLHQPPCYFNQSVQPSASVYFKPVTMSNPFIKQRSPVELFVPSFFSKIIKKSNICYFSYLLGSAWCPGSRGTKGWDRIQRRPGLSSAVCMTFKIQNFLFVIRCLSHVIVMSNEQSQKRNISLVLHLIGWDWREIFWTNNRTRKERKPIEYQIAFELNWELP